MTTAMGPATCPHGYTSSWDCDQCLCPVCDRPDPDSPPEANCPPGSHEQRPMVPKPTQGPGPRMRPYKNGYAHYDECPEGSPDPREIEWICDQGHWLAWDIPPAMSDRCPVVLHEANADGRCVGTLSRPECICEDPRP